MIRRLTPMLVLLAIGSLLAGCGGNSSQDDKHDGKSSRSGYFTSDESATLNPVLAAWNEATQSYYTRYDKCNAEARHKYDAGASPRASVACHLRDTKAMIVAIEGVGDAVAKLDGDWRAACDDQLELFSTFVEAHHDAWTALQSDWVAYANGKPTPKINDHTKAAGETTTKFAGTELPALAVACYTKADRADATPVTKARSDK